MLTEGLELGDGGSGRCFILPTFFTMQRAVLIGGEGLCPAYPQEKFDMIVVGTAGKGAGASLRKMVLGSTSQQVQKQACCAVLAVKDPAANFCDGDPSSS